MITRVHHAAEHAGVQVAAAGLTLTSIAGVLGYVPVIVAVIAGIMAIISYTFATLDSPAFNRFLKSIRRPKP
jgi:hypothetical protein